MGLLTHSELKSALPESGLRKGDQWLFSSRPFELTKGEARSMMRLGHPLAKFQRASESIYQRSAKGLLPTWIAQLLDAGKPEWLIEQQRSARLERQLPQVIRPDLILTEQGYALTELDSVPGGMGITAWLSRVYSDAGFDVLGGADGMLDGFRSVLPDGGRVLVSDESADYRGEMQWLVDALGEGYRMERAEDDRGGSGAAYRFFEWFDWQNISAAKSLAGKADLTPPCKPHLEEKLWLALLWSPALQTLWRRELRGAHLQRVQGVVPYSWVVDPAEMPPQAALPKLGVQTWAEVGQFSQKERELVLKISGFHELAWGSRGVKIGHDVPSDEWSTSVNTAAVEFDRSPWMMQEFRAGKMIEHPYFDPETGEEKLMQGRVRLCPYFFTNAGGETKFGGALATIVPADKKKIHGMKDGVLVPCVIKD